MHRVFVLEPSAAALNASVYLLSVAGEREEG